MRKHLLIILSLYILTRFLLVLTGVYCLRHVGIEAGNYGKNLHLTDNRSAIVEIHYRWDAVWYLDIAENGYLNQVSNPNYRHWGDLPFASGFFPLLPCLIGLTHLVVPSWELSGIITAYLLGFASILLLYRELAAWMDPDFSFRTSILLILFPSSIFLSLPFAESLILTGFLAIVRGIRTRQWEWTVLGSLITVLAKPIGIFLPFALLFMNGIRKRQIAITIAAWGVGLLIALGVFWSQIGTITAPFVRQSMMRGLPSGPWRAFISFLVSDKYLFGWRGSWIDLFWALAFLLVLATIVFNKKYHSFVRAWSWILLLVPLCSSLVSFQRLSVVIYPFFAEIEKKIIKTWIWITVCILFWMAQLYWMFRYATFQWIG